MDGSRVAHRTGWVLTVVAALFLSMDAGMKVAGAQVAVQATANLGFDAAQVPVLGIVLLVSTLLYALPSTSVLGAVLVTAYLGGAVAVNFQHHNPLLSHSLFGVYIGVIAWAGLYLRSPRLRSQIPLRREP